MANTRPFLYGLKDINQYTGLNHLQDKETLESITTTFFSALNNHDYTNPIFSNTDTSVVAAKLLDGTILVTDGLPKCDGLRRGIADILASHHILWKHFPTFQLVVDEVLIFVDERFALADVLVLFSTRGLPVGRNGDGGLCVLRWVREGGGMGEWRVRDGMHMQGSSLF